MVIKPYQVEMLVLQGGPGQVFEIFMDMKRLDQTVFFICTSSFKRRESHFNKKPVDCKLFRLIDYLGIIYVYIIHKLHSMTGE